MVRTSFLRKTLLALVPITLFSICLVGFSKHQDPRWVLHLVIAHDPPTPYYREAMREYARQVNLDTHGDVEIRVQTTDQYGTVDSGEILDNVVAGKMEMTAIATSVLGRYSNDMFSFSLPYLFRDYDHAARVIDGPIGEQIASSLPDYGLVGLAYTYSGGFDVLPTTGLVVHKPSDLNGVSIRVPKNPVVEATFSAWGAMPEVSALRDIDPLADGGLIDGAELTYSRLLCHKMHTTVLNELHHNFFLTMVVINEQVLNSMPPAYQTIMKETAKHVAAQERSKALDEIAGVRQQARARGIQIVTLSPEEQKVFAEAAAPVYAEFAHTFTPHIVADMQNLY